MKSEKFIKLLTILIFIEIAIFMFNINTVNATEITEQNLQEILDKMPNTIRLELPEIECEKAGDITGAYIKKELRKNEIDYIQKEEVGLEQEDNTQLEEITDENNQNVLKIQENLNGKYSILLELQGDLEGITIAIRKPKIYLCEINKATLQVYALIEDKIECKEKEIELIYNNHNKYNSTDEEYVKGLEIESPKYYEVNLDDCIFKCANKATQQTNKTMEKEEKKVKLVEALVNSYIDSDNEKIEQIREQIDNLEVEYAIYYDTYTELYIERIEEYYNNLVKDDDITIKVSFSKATTNGGMNMWTVGEGTFLGIFKNEILYDIRKMGNEFSIPVINVPDNVEKDDVNEYVKDYIMRYNQEFGSQITKIEEGTQDIAGIDIEDGYTICSESGMDSCVIIKTLCYEEQKQYLGDANGDNIIDTKDAILVLRYTIGLEILGEEQKQVVDVDKNGEINTEDAIKILRYTIGLEQF